MSELQRTLLKGKAPVLEEDEEEQETLAELGSARNSRSRRHLAGNLSPLKADAFFEQALEINSDGDIFRVYYTSARPDQSDDAGNGTLIVCHHGASSNGLGFACFAAEVRKATSGELGVLAIDARGHGKSRVKDSDPPVLTLDNMASDLVRVLKMLFPEKSKAPTLLLVGHSMGGPVVVKACDRIQNEVAPVLGCAILEAVEGTALEAIPMMTAHLQSFPKTFDSVEDAIAWHLSSKTVNNPTSARVSVPAAFAPTADGSESVRWRTDLLATSPYWENWFTGMSASFLAIKTAKLLVLAGTERLDKTLMVGQMQGKFQLTVWPDVGHSLQEDAPERLAHLIIEFWRRNDTTDILRNVKKVGQV